MASNLLLLLAGFGDRLLSEVKKLAPKDIKIRVRLSCISLAHICMYQTEILMTKVVHIKYISYLKQLFQISAPQERLYSTWIG